MKKSNDVLEMVQWCKSQELSLNETQNIIRRTFGNKGLKILKKLSGSTLNYETSGKSEFTGKMEILSDRAKEEVQGSLLTDEELAICMTGSNNDYLVATNQRILIVKHGISFDGKFEFKIKRILYDEVCDVVLYKNQITCFLEIVLKNLIDGEKGRFKRKNCEDHHECNGIHILEENLKYYKPFIALLKSKIVETGNILKSKDLDKDLTSKITSLGKLYKTGKISLNEYETAKTRIIEQKWY